MLAVLLALSSSLLYALASVLQHRGAVDQPADQSMKLGLLVRLARNPAWVLGLVCDGAGYLLQFLALGHGPIVVVQPLLVLGLLFALPLEAAWTHRRLSRADWVAAVMVCAGLGVFLAVADPAPGTADTATVNWLIMLLVVSSVAAVLIAAARRSGPRRKAVLLAGATGVVYGAAAALTKTTSHLLARGLVPMLTHWEPYILLVFGVGGMLLAQSAFQAEALDASLPTMTVGDPIVSIAIGASLFQESLAAGPGAVTVEVVSLIAMTVGVFVLARADGQMTVGGPAGAGPTETAPAAGGRGAGGG